MEKVQKIRIIKEKQIKTKREKKIKVQSNNVITKYALNNIHVDFDK